MPAVDQARASQAGQPWGAAWGRHNEFGPGRLAPGPFQQAARPEDGLFHHDWWSDDDEVAQVRPDPNQTGRPVPDPFPGNALYLRFSPPD
eukprot:5882504-Alexandrium_andersonii.AAC.1